MQKASIRRGRALAPPQKQRHRQQVTVPFLLLSFFVFSSAGRRLNANRAEALFNFHGHKNADYSEMKVAVVVLAVMDFYTAAAAMSEEWRRRPLFKFHVLQNCAGAFPLSSLEQAHNSFSRLKGVFPLLSPVLISCVKLYTSAF